jgi:hypothetical protein
MNRMSAYLVEVEVAASAAPGSSALKIEPNRDQGNPVPANSSERPMAAARGIVNGLLIAVPFWILLILAAVLLR